MGLENATKFLKYKTLSEPRVLKLNKQCEDYDNRMDKITSDLITYRSTNFIKKYSLSPGAKENIKEEFQRLTKHIKLNQKCIHSELARILEEKGKQEVKPVPIEAPAAQPSGGTTVVEVQHDPMNSYNPMMWKDCKLTMKTNWIDYIDWKRKIDNHFNYVEKLASHKVQRRVL